MRAQRLPDGRILAPHRAEAEDGTIGDALLPLSPGDPMYDLWDAELRETGD